MKRLMTTRIFLFTLLCIAPQLRGQNVLEEIRFLLPRAVGNDEAVVFTYTLGSNMQARPLHFEWRMEGGQSESFFVYLQKGTHTLFWYPHQFSSSLQSATVRVAAKSASLSAEEMLVFLGKLSLHMRIEKKQQMATPASLYDMLHWKQQFSTHEDFTLFRWQQQPDVLVFFFRNKTVQARYLKRAAFFVEKRLTRGTLVYDSDIAHRKGWGAHDYDASDLLRMFEMGRVDARPRRDAVTKVFPFHPEELLLKRILVELGLFTISEEKRQEFRKRATDATFIATLPLLQSKGAVVSVAADYSQELMRVLLGHELLHVLFFSDQNLRNFMRSSWESLTPTEKKIWRSFLAYNGYDETYEYLVINEFFAYLYQRPLSVLDWYISARIIPESGNTLTETQTRTFIRRMKKIAAELERFMVSAYAMRAGDVGYVQAASQLN